MDCCCQCRQPYDGLLRPPKEAPCGHTMCCWGTVKKCPKCNAPFSLTDLKPSFPLGSGVNYSPNPLTNGTRTSVKPFAKLPGAISSGLSKLRVNCMNGTKCEIHCNTSCTSVAGLKRQVHEQTGISAERQSLLHQGRNMEDGKMLSNYGVTDGAKIQMGSRCYGG